MLLEGLLQIVRMADQGADIFKDIEVRMEAYGSSFLSISSP